MNNITGILSGKGGTGKTTVAVNLALAMHKLEENVVLVDGDIRNPNMGLHLGVLDHHLTLHDVMERDIPLLEALHIHETGLRFIPAHISLSYLGTDPVKLKEIFNNPELDYNILLDAPSGLSNDVISILEVCNQVIIVTTPYLPDITDCLKTIEVARNMGVEVKGIIMNHSRKKGYEISEKEIEAVSGVEIMHTIPWDEEVLKSVYAKVPVVERNPLAPSAISFMQLAAKLTERDYKPPRFLRLRRFISRLP
jgi:septum site-determining protein MinD